MQDHLKAYNSVGDVNIERERKIIFRASCIYVPKVNVNMNYPNLFMMGTMLETHSEQSLEWMKPMPRSLNFTFDIVNSFRIHHSLTLLH